MSQDSSVGIVTCYGLDGPGIESWWGSEIFLAGPDRPRGPTSLLYNEHGVYTGDKATRAWRQTTHSHLEPRLKKEYSYTSTPPPSLRGLF